MKKEICPICKGTGKVEIRNGISIDSKEVKKSMALELKNKGYTIRQIQVALGYKSPRSIQLILK